MVESFGPVRAKIGKNDITADDAHLMYNAFQAEYPGIRVLGPNTIAVMPQGDVRRLPEVSGEMPLFLLTKNELRALKTIRDDAREKGEKANAEDYKAVLPIALYRRIYSNYNRLEFGLHYEANTEDLKSVKRFKAKRRKAFFDAYKVDKGWWDDLDPDRLHTVQDQEGLKRHLGIKLGEHFDFHLEKIDWEDVIQNANDRLGLKGASHDNITPDTKEDLANASKIEVATARLMEMRIPEDFLKILSHRGMNLLISQQMQQTETTRGALGLSGASNGFVHLIYDSAKHYRYACEELVHQVDQVIGYSCREEWIKATRADFAREDKYGSIEFADLINDYTGKASIFDETVYGVNDRPMEFLPDMHVGAVFWDDIWKAIHKDYKSCAKKIAEIEEKTTQTEEEKTELLALREKQEKLQLHVTNYENLEGDKEALMVHYFPKTWPLYKGFMREVTREADRIRRVEGQEDREAGGDGSLEHGGYMAALLAERVGASMELPPQ